ncbi:MAG: hypothetical protein JO102_05960, partial [Elusimicrobia bacterium]|nr:hypothetical protein [Elusimicrobiota bacterium]
MNLRTKIISLAVAVVSAAGTAIAAEPFAIRPEGADKIVTCPLQSESKPLSWQANKGDSVRFSYAVPESAYQHEPSPVKVRVSVLTHGAWKSLFEESLDPAKNAEDRGWHRQKADLSSFAGEKVELKFTSRRASGRNNAPVAVWGGVRVGNFHRKPGEFN